MSSNKDCLICGGTGVAETGNNDFPCGCAAGDVALFNTPNGIEAGYSIKEEFQRLEFKRLELPNSNMPYSDCRPKSFEREPSLKEMEYYLGLAGRDELLPGDLHPEGWPTVRRCQRCSFPVAGGPTVCGLCAAMKEMMDRALAAEMVLSDALESGRIMNKYLKPEISYTPGSLGTYLHDIGRDDGGSDE